MFASSKRKFVFGFVIFILSTAFCVAVIPASPKDIKASSKQQSTYKTEYVVVLVIDGPRMTETFMDSTLQYIPNLSGFLAPQGVLCRDFKNEGPTYTNAGHTAITTGNYQRINNAGMEYPKFPSMFQYFLKTSGAQQSDAYVIASKGKLSILGNTKHTDWKDAYLPTLYCGVNGSGVGYTSDEATFKDAMEILQSKHPKLTLINLLEVDVNGHANLWSNYLEAIRKTDDKARKLWEFIQSDSVYANKTTLFITNDHGRHSKGRRDGFISHGDNCTGCRSIYLVALGPDFKVGKEINVGYDLIDIPATISEMLHFDMPTARGKVMTELFR